MWSLFKDVKGKGVLGTIQNEGSSLKSCSQTGALQLNSSYCPLLAASLGWTAAPKTYLQSLPQGVRVKHWGKTALCSSGSSSMSQSRGAMDWFQLNKVKIVPKGTQCLLPQQSVTFHRQLALGDVRSWNFWVLPSMVLRLSLPWTQWQPAKQCSKRSTTLPERTSGNNI